tara:strand:+ start:114 stop:494 length:381 start_codon:yes stop_codon:yes gene_type:complete
MIHRIKTSKAPKAIGPYSQGSKIDNLVFTSGQIAIDPSSGNLVIDDFKKEVIQVLNNVNAVLKSGGSNINQVIKLTVFIKDISNFQIVNDIFVTYFDADYPSRSVVEVSDLPLGVNIEIEAIGKIL